MSGRGRGGGGRGTQQSRGGGAGGSGSGRGRGMQPSRGGGPGRGRGRGSYGPPPPSVASSSVPPFESVPLSPTPPVVAALSHDVEQRLTVAPRASAEVQPQPVEHDLAVENPGGQQQLPPMSSKALAPPARPGFGTVGQKVVVRANHFLVQVANRDLHHYDVCDFPVSYESLTLNLTSA